MSKLLSEGLLTEGQFLSSFILRVLTPFFQDKYGDKSKLIIARRILEFEFDKTLDSKNYMRKEEGLSSILYAIIFAQFKERGHKYIVPPALPTDDQKRIKKIYGIIADTEVKQFYAQHCTKSGDIELPADDILIDTEFLYRIEDLCLLRDKFLIVINNILNSGQLFKFDSCQEVNEFKISRKEYLEFDINKYNLNELFIEELAKQINFLRNYIDNVGKVAPDIKNVKTGADFADEIVRGLINVFQFLLSRRVIEIQADLVRLIKWELLRLRLARVLDQVSVSADDFKKLVTFLLNLKPNALREIKMTIPASQTFSLQTQKILDSFKELKGVTKSCGQIYANAQLNIALAGRFARQKQQTESMLVAFRNELKSASPEKQGEILQAIQAVELGINRLAHTELKQAFFSAVQEKAEIACQLFELDNLLLGFKRQHKGRLCSPELTLQKKLLTSHLDLISQKAASLQKNLEEKQKSTQSSHSSSSASSGSHLSSIPLSQSSVALLPAPLPNGKKNMGGNGVSSNTTPSIPS